MPPSVQVPVSGTRRTPNTLSCRVTVRCDKSISYIRNEEREWERGSGARSEDPEQGARIRDGVRNTLRPCVNSVISPGNEDPPCVHMGERVTLYLDG